MFKKTILLMIRKRLGLKKNERFQFVGQKSNAVYYFTSEGLMKDWRGIVVKSGVSLNWLLDNDCEIKKCNAGGERV